MNLRQRRISAARSPSGSTLRARPSAIAVLPTPRFDAAETIIFLTEARADFLQGIDVPLDEPSELQGFSALGLQDGDLIGQDDRHGDARRKLTVDWESLAPIKLDATRIPTEVCTIRCAPKARVTSGGRFHPESCRLIWWTSNRTDRSLVTKAALGGRAIQRAVT